GDANEDGPATTMSADFSDVDASDTHGFSIDTTGTRGSVIDDGDGTFSYDPSGAFESLAAHETATDTFIYTVTDNHGASSTATVTIILTGRNDAPVAVDDAATTAEDTARTFTQADLKGNDTDVDNTSTQLSVTAVSNPSNGMVMLNLDGTVTFTPATNFFGIAGFDY